MRPTHSKVRALRGTIHPNELSSIDKCPPPTYVEGVPNAVTHTNELPENFISDLLTYGMDPIENNPPQSERIYVKVTDPTLGGKVIWEGYTEAICGKVDGIEHHALVDYLSDEVLGAMTSDEWMDRIGELEVTKGQ